MRETIDYSTERSWFAAGDHPLERRERERLQKSLEGGEEITQYVRGRSEGRPAVWAATERRLVFCSLGWFGRTSVLPYDRVAAHQVEEGAHGWTIRLDSASGREALVAVAPSLGRGFVTLLESKTGKPVTFLASRRSTTSRLFVSHHGAPAPHETPTRAVAPPPAAPADHTAVGLTAALREAAELHRSGALSDDEFTALKRRLLGG
ncbi:MAG TPA: SHOCT domain-containing protein [Gemmatimonadales bacterium]|nr:SHOCT domain-containing protein [Gemmatimonadales bacterium]